MGTHGPAGTFQKNGATGNGLSPAPPMSCAIDATGCKACSQDRKTDRAVNAAGCKAGCRDGKTYGTCRQGKPTGFANRQTEANLLLITP